MRNIALIIEELYNHPDYLGGRVWTKEHIADQITHHYQYEHDDYDIIIDEEQFTDDDWNGCREMVEEYYDAQEQHYGFPIDFSTLDDLCLRIDRDIKINKTLNDK